MADISSIMTDAEVMEEIGMRLRALRGKKKVQDAARLAGLSRETVSRAEKGDNPQLLTVLRLLRAYGRMGALDSFIPEAEVSPIAALRARVSGRNG